MSRKLTEKGQKIVDFLEKENYYEVFTAASLSEMMGEKIAAATLTSLFNHGVVDRFESSPRTYQFLKDGVKRTEEKKTEYKSSGDVVANLFNLANTIEAEIQAITHWMNTETYATEPGTQIGIYKIVEKETGKVIYVGKTERPFSMRWKEHKEMLENGNHHSPKLQEFFNKINKDFSKISFEILQELPADSKIIDLRERFWIEKYSETILNYLKPRLIK